MTRTITIARRLNQAIICEQYNNHLYKSFEGSTCVSDAIRWIKKTLGKDVGFKFDNTHANV